MSKDTFYFSHDYNTRSDDKIKRLIRKHGMVGYGVFWAIIEDLYNNANAMRLDCDGIAYDLRSNSELINSVINDFDLFVINDGNFGSIGVENRLSERNEKSKSARKSAVKRWEKVKQDANAMRTQCERNAIKERKGKEIKGNENIIPDWALGFKNYDPKLIYPFENEKFSTAWDLWIKYRSEKKLTPYKEIGHQAVLKKISRISGGDINIALSIIIQSIENNWAGIFEIKNSQNGRKQNYDDKVAEYLSRNDDRPKDSCGNPVEKGHSIFQL